jgi:hypothetical protein
LRALVFRFPRKWRKTITGFQGFDCFPKIKPFFLSNKSDNVPRSPTGKAEKLPPFRINSRRRLTVSTVSMKITAKLLFVIFGPRIYLVPIVIKYADYRDLFPKTVR